MVLGMSLSTFTAVHVIISLIGIATGIIVLNGLIKGQRMDNMTAIFLTSTVLTSATGYLFPVEHILPSHIVGAISLVLLAGAIVARYGLHLQGASRSTYVVCAVAALYLNCFVLVAQMFLKIPALHALAPQGKEPPFAVAQLILLAAFVWLGFKAVKGFRAKPVEAPTAWRDRKAS